MKNKLTILILLCILNVNFSHAQTYTLHGHVTDSESGEQLISALIRVENTTTGVVTNTYGFYSLSLKEGDYKLAVSYLGYAAQSIPIALNANLPLDIVLTPTTGKLKEVVVTDNATEVFFEKAGTVSIPMQMIKAMPAIAGEVDIFKSLQLMPGISTAVQGTTNLSVRGGSFDQTLILLDEAPVYNPSHALGFFSTFNADAIKDVQVYKGFVPYQFGGRLSAVVDMHMKEGNNKKFEGTGSIGLLSSKLTVEGPVGKSNKASYLFSGRYSYTGKTVNLIGTLGSEIFNIFKNVDNNNEINFYDLYAKVNYKFNKKHHLYLSGYTGKDHFRYYLIDRKNTMNWGNSTATARWNFVANQKLFANTSVIYSKYHYSNFLVNDNRDFEWSAGLSEVDFKSDWDYYPSPKHHIKFGIAAANQNFEPGRITPRDSASVSKPIVLDNKKAILLNAYIGNEQQLSDKIKLIYGLRFNYFATIGPGIFRNYAANLITVIDSTLYKKGDIIQSYTDIEPRVSFDYQLSSNSHIKLTYNRSKQYMHLLSNSTVGLPTDIWLPSDRNIAPQTADQFSGGYFRDIKNHAYTLSLEGYYKTMDGVLDFIDNANLFLNPQIETQVRTGKGEAYGVELLLEKHQGNVTGWASYTWAKTQRTIEGINRGNAYSPLYDKRHSISLVGLYKHNAQWSFSGSFIYSSGGFLTLPQGTYIYQGASFQYYTQKNGFQLPSHHQLDLSATRKSKKYTQQRLKKSWVFSIYNAYSRANVFTVYGGAEDANLRTNKIYALSLFGIVPTVKFQVDF